MFILLPVGVLIQYYLKKVDKKFTKHLLKENFVGLENDGKSIFRDTASLNFNIKRIKFRQKKVFQLSQRKRAHFESNGHSRSSR